jgi:hypothetical protein
VTLFGVECEAPAGGYGPGAVLAYDSQGRYVERVDYLDIIFDAWLGGELIQHVGSFCVTQSLWDYFVANQVRGVFVRDMAVTRGDQVNQLYPGRVIPVFKQLVLPVSAKGKARGGLTIELESLPEAEMFTGLGLPLIVNNRVKELLTAYGVTGLEYEKARVS